MIKENFWKKLKKIYVLTTFFIILYNQKTFNWTPGPQLVGKIPTRLKEIDFAKYGLEVLIALHILWGKMSISIDCCKIDLEYLHMKQFLNQICNKSWWVLISNCFYWDKIYFLAMLAIS